DRFALPDAENLDLWCNFVQIVIPFVEEDICNLIQVELFKRIFHSLAQWACCKKVAKHLPSESVREHFTKVISSIAGGKERLGNLCIGGCFRKPIVHKLRNFWRKTMKTRKFAGKSSFVDIAPVDTFHPLNPNSPSFSHEELVFWRKSIEVKDNL